jgi:hypothetical protein
VTAVDTAVISARALTKTFGELEAVKAVDLEVRPARWSGPERLIRDEHPDQRSQSFGGENPTIARD